MNDGAKASTSSDGLTVLVDGSTGEVKQCVKKDDGNSDTKLVKKNDEESVNKGTEYTAKDTAKREMLFVMQNC